MLQRTSRLTARLAQAAPRCICQFSSTCKLHHSETSPATSSDLTPGQANVGAYDRLFAGLAISSPPSSSSSNRSSRAVTSRPIKNIKSYGPAFSRAPMSKTSQKRPGPEIKANSRSDRSSRLNPADLAAFRNSLDAFFPDNNDSEATKQSGSENDVEGEGATPQFRWAELLDKVAEGGRKLPDSSKKRKQSDAQELPIPQPHMQSPSSVQQDTLQLESDLAAAQEAEELKEEFKSLTTAAEAIQWMQERIFGFSSSTDSSSSSLAGRVSDPSHSTNERLLRVYPYLLTDLSRFLRATSPHASLLPLKLASAYSPASYLHGCTTALYVSTMKTRWRVWGDIEGCLNLMQEMERGAVTMDLRVVALVKEMQDAIVKDRKRAEQQTKLEVLEREQAARRDGERQLDAIATEEQEGEADSPLGRETTDHHPIRPPRAISYARRTDAEEKIYEREIEKHTFFSPAERRALTTMEEIIVENTERQQADRRRAYDLQDAIMAQSRSNSSGSGGKGGSDEGMTSSINALINSYGQFERPRSAAIRVDLDQPKRRPERFRPRERDFRSLKRQETRAAAATKTGLRPSDQSAPATDILSQAVSELSEKEASKPKRKPKQKSGKAKQASQSSAKPKKKLGKTYGSEIQISEALDRL